MQNSPNVSHHYGVAIETVRCFQSPVGPHPQTHSLYVTEFDSHTCQAGTASGHLETPRFNSQVNGRLSQDKTHAVPTAHTETAKPLTVFSEDGVRVSSNYRTLIYFHTLSFRHNDPPLRNVDPSQELLNPLALMPRLWRAGFSGWGLRMSHFTYPILSHGSHMQPKVRGTAQTSGPFVKKALSGSVARELWESQSSFFSWEEKDFLPHGVDFAALEGPFGNSEAEVCPMGAHTQGPREPLKSQNCISGKNTANSWAARPLCADVASFCASW